MVTVTGHRRRRGRLSWRVVIEPVADVSVDLEWVGVVQPIEIAQHSHTDERITNGNRRRVVRPERSPPLTGIEPDSEVSAMDPADGRDHAT
jgi:hypothetical protein